MSRPLPNESLDSKLSECGGPEDEHIRGDDTVTSPTTKDGKPAAALDVLEIRW